MSIGRSNFAENKEQTLRIGEIHQRHEAELRLAEAEARKSHELFQKIKQARIGYIDQICRARPANTKFRTGWLRRLNAL